MFSVVGRWVVCLTFICTSSLVPQSRSFVVGDLGPVILQLRAFQVPRPAITPREAPNLLPDDGLLFPRLPWRRLDALDRSDPVNTERRFLLPSSTPTPCSASYVLDQAKDFNLDQKLPFDPLEHSKVWFLPVHAFGCARVPKRIANSVTASNLAYSPVQRTSITRSKVSSGVCLALGYLTRALGHNTWIARILAYTAPFLPSRRTLL